MPWNSVQIRELCNAKNLPYPEEYLRSLSWKHWKALYHAQQAQEVWDEFKAAHPHGYGIGGVNKEWWDAYAASAAETESTVQALHAEADIIAQVVNQIVLGGHFSERAVTFNCVLNTVSDQELAPNVVAELETFKNSQEFRYVNAFCNRAKHRRLIKREWRAESRQETGYKEGVRFLAFSYEGDNFPPTWAFDINSSCRESLGRYVERIGKAIIDYLQSNP